VRGCRVTAMRCSKCGAENLDRAKFCEECASPFTRRCLSCGSENSPTAKFCIECAKPLEAETVPAEPGASSRRSEGGERRHLTVLFSDLVNSTEIAARLDPEEWHEILASYHRTTSDAVAKFGGQVAQYLGDGVMAFFGYPQAHDDDAERAVRAGLAILDAISETNRAPGGHHKLEIAVRVGIHTGHVVMHEGDQGIKAFGDVPNIASRVQTAAAPNTTLITDPVLQLVSGLFVVEDRGTQTLKGVPEPVQLYSVSSSSRVRGRLRTSASRGLTPFVGRDDELRLLMNRWELAREGEGQVVLITGEAGIGKSRLVRQFQERLSTSSHRWVQTDFSPYLQQTPFASTADVIHQSFNWSGVESVEEKLDRLDENIALAGLKPAEAVPLIAPLLNLPVPDKYPPLLLSSEQQRKRLLATLIGLLIGTTRGQPLVVVLEDLQWSDPSSLDLQQLTVEQNATVPMLLLYTARPEFRAPWPMRAHHTQITLNRLSRSQAREMVTRVAASEALLKDVLDTVVERAGGVPLFAEELTRAVLEGGTAEAVRAIPATLQDSLMARLDRLGTAKDAACVASVIGREFSYELLHAVSTMTEDELQSALAKLTEAELIYARGIPPEAIYQFKHALLQDAAYEALLKSRRRQLHRRVAETLAEKYPEVAETQPELLALHWTEAGAAEPAVAAWRKAGRQAVKRFANAEAVADLSRALEVLNNLPESRARDTEELSLQMLLTTPLIATKGYTAPEVEKACYRARDLSQQIGDTPHLSAILGGLTSIYVNRGELPTALELANRMLSLAERKDDPVRLVWAHYSLGMIFAESDDYQSARSHLDKSIAHYNFQERQSYGYVQDPGATGLSLLAYVLHMLGYPEQAREKLRQAMDWAGKLGDPYTLQWVLIQACLLHFLRGEFQSAFEGAEERIAICRKHGFEPALRRAIEHRGLALTYLGRNEEGISQLLQIWERVEAEKARDQRTDFEDFNILYLTAQAYWRSGQARPGLKAFADAQALSNEVGFPQTERLPLKGNLLLLLKDSASLTEAERLFRSAIQIERTYGAKWPELLSTTALARLLRDTGRRDEARAMLAEIYNWFTEGFDTADLKDAKALLEELGNSP
jgi:class 3 adenylate cyclase/tetratricopeptide (TPR) repeat protein